MKSCREQLCVSCMSSVSMYPSVIVIDRARKLSSDYILSLMLKLLLFFLSLVSL